MGKGIDNLSATPQNPCALPVALPKPSIMLTTFGTKGPGFSLPAGWDRSSKSKPIPKPDISQAVSRVIHEALAKQSWHRSASVREFAEILLKSFRNETFEMLARIQPRVERARKAFERNDCQFAPQNLGELEAEEHMFAPGKDQVGLSYLTFKPI
jgi:hypothetical protein